MSAFDDHAGPMLVRLARSAIAQRLGEHAPAPPMAPWLQEPGATFVTLNRENALRGCIGTLEASRPLVVDVHENALAAAFRDPRFKPLVADEWPSVSVEVSLLSALEPLPLGDESALLAQLRPGVDGLVLEFGHHRGTFLPQVWEQLPEPAAFLISLKRKAGLPPDFWEPGMRLCRYTVTKWREQDLDLDA